jgi:glycerophosphoryl diester phosphodiesterase
MAMHYWTINDEAEMRRLIVAGADGIITDDPALLMRVMDDLNEE